jgi:hypothetical protein
MNKYLSLLAAVAVIAVPSAGLVYASDSNSWDGTGTGLLKACSGIVETQGDPNRIREAQGPHMLWGYCLGMANGVWVTLLSNEKLLNRQFESPVFCPPDEKVTNGQIARITVQYLEDHPELLHKRDAVLMIEALLKAFWCG